MRLGRLGVFGALWAACGSCHVRSQTSADKIIGGRETSEWPAVGYLARNNDMWCTATLIAPNKILTAAHCVSPRNGRDVYSFHVGPKVGATRAYGVSKVVAHPKYDSDASHYDIAYLELAETVPEAILPVASSLGAVPVGEELLLIGYGRNQPPASGAGGGSGIKRRGLTKIVAVNETKIRAQVAGVSSCNGDSGGPALFTRPDGSVAIVGVVSCGDFTCGSYGVYTRTDRFRTFLGLSTEADFNQDLSRCGATTPRGACDGSALVSCSEDCYEAKFNRRDCGSVPGGACRVFPGRDAAACIDGTWVERDFALREAKIVGGRLDFSASIDGDVFFDTDVVDAATKADDVSSQGRFHEVIKKGAHTYIVRRWYSASGLAISRPRKLMIGDGPEPVVLAFGLVPVVVAATVTLAKGEALYFTGEGRLLGDWKVGYRMKSENGRWTYRDALPMGIAYKVVRSRDLGEEITLGDQVSWEKGPNRVLSRPVVMTVLEENIEPHF